MPPPRLSCPKVGQPVKNGMSHCTALLKNYCLGLLKDKKEMKFLQNSCAQVFFHPKNVNNNPQISWRTYVTLYTTGPLSHCTAIADFWCEYMMMSSHLKMVLYLLRKWYRMIKQYFPIENQHFGVYMRHSYFYFDFPYSVTHF